MRYIAVPIEAEERECGECEWRGFPTGLHGIPFCRLHDNAKLDDRQGWGHLPRCPACLEAEAKLDALVKAGHGALTVASEDGAMLDTDKEWYDLEQALAALKEDSDGK
jgi:hypothetical protein